MGEHSLTRALRTLLLQWRTAALGTVSDEGHAFVSRVPYAIDSNAGEFILHISALAAHTAFLRARPRASLLVAQAEVPGEPVHALPRVSLDVQAHFCEAGSADAARVLPLYLARFPEAEPMTQLGDFRFVRLAVLGARQVAGFGAARSLDADEVRRAMAIDQ